MKQKVPQFVNKPTQVFLFEMDEVVVLVFLLLIFNFYSDFPFYVAFGVPVLGCWFYFKQKKKSPRGFLPHLAFRFGLMKFKDMPHRFVRKFFE